MGETRGSYCKKALVVSQTEPTNPSDGLLWYKPDLCETTTTTTLAPPSCPEGSIYNGWMTVGSTEIPIPKYGYSSNDNFGLLNPISTITELFWLNDGQIDLFIPDCQNPIVYINGLEFNNFYNDGGISWIMDNVLVNPFAPVGELSSICILCGEATTTTTPISTTTTRIPCDYEGALTIGNFEDVYGYSVTFEIGNINPLDENIKSIVSYNDGLLEVKITECYDEVILYIDEVPYILLFIEESDGTCFYEVEELSNLFSAVGETVNIKLCYGTPCTTTTTPID